MIPKPMTSAEVAARLGDTPDRFYRKRHFYHAIDRMPRPISEVGRPKWDRASMEAWLTRHHPARPAAAANDPLPLPDPVTDDEHRARLAVAYAPQRPVPALDRRRRAAGG